MGPRAGSDMQRGRAIRMPALARAALRAVLLALFAGFLLTFAHGAFATEPQEAADPSGNLYTRAVSRLESEAVSRDGDWEYVFNGGSGSDTITLVKYLGSDSVVSIDPTLDGYEVAGLGDELFKNNTNLTEVYLPSSIITIGADVFVGCTNLETASLTAVEELHELGGFTGCASLESVMIPACVQTLSDSAFEGCSALAAAAFQDPSSLTEIGARAFKGCGALASFEVPPNVTAIGEEAFLDCALLATVDFDGSALQSIGDHAFKGCAALQTFHFGDAIRSVGAGAFSGCSSLAFVSYGKRLPSSFGGDPQDGVFLGCDALEMMVFPQNTSEKDALKNGWRIHMTKLEVLYNDGGTAEVYSIDPSLSHTSVTLPAQVGGCTITAIDAAAAYKNSKLTEVIFPEDTQISRIGDHAFANCTALESIAIPASVTRIETGAFRGCTALEDVEFKTTSLAKLEVATFADCTSLKFIELPEGLATMTGNEFLNCTALETVHLPSTLTYLGPSFLTDNGKKMHIKTMRMPDSNAEIDMPPDRTFMGTWATTKQVVFEVTYGSWSDYVWFQRHLDNAVFTEDNRSYVPVDIARTDGSVDRHITNPDSEYTGSLKLPTLTGQRWYKAIYEFKPITGEVADYTVAPAPGYDCVSVGEQKAIIWGQKPHFTGSITVDFEITPKDIFSATLSGVDAVTWDDSSWTLGDWDPAPIVSIKVDDLEFDLVEGRDYTASYKDNQLPGKATITVNGQGNYGGTKDFHFTIEKASVGDAEVSAIPDQIYTGSQIKPVPAKVRLKDRKGAYKDALVLNEGDDFTLSYGANTDIGQGTVVLTGIGDFVKGSKKVTFNIVPPDYTVRFAANVPSNASTKCSGSMGDQGFGREEKKALSANRYTLPGYDFAGWNTKADGSGVAYSDGEEVEGLSDNGAVVVLYAQWRARSYRIVFNPGTMGGNEHVQMAYFDQPGKLDKYSDEAFGWNSDGKTLHGWAGTGFGSFYGDGADFVNLCGTPRENGSLADRELVAEWVQGGQIIVAVTKDGVPQSGLADALVLAQESVTFVVPVSYKDGNYVFNPSQVIQPGGATGQLPPGEYELAFKAPGYPTASARITYGEEAASGVVFAYYTVSLAKDPDYGDYCEVAISGGEPVAGEPGSVVALDSGMLGIGTTVAEGYRFDGYTAVGVAPVWEGDDPAKAQQSIKVQGAAAITAHVSPKPVLTVTPLPQNCTYNGQTQGESNTAYEDPSEIAQKVSAEGLQEGDALARVVLDGQGDDAGAYELAASNVRVVNAAGDVVTDDYVVVCAPGVLTIEPAKATITVASASKVVGEDDPTFTGSVAGLIAEGDLGKVRYVRTNSDEEPGTYAGVIVAEYVANPNYDVAVFAGDFTIRALFTLRWLDGDGSLLSEKTYVEGDPAPVYDGAQPTKAATARYTYAFSGWDGGTVDGAVTTYRPLFDKMVNTYAVRFVNDDGAELQSGRVAYGKMPKYTGKTPQKAPTERYTYEFAGWDPKVVAVTGDATYTAKFRSAKKAYDVLVAKAVAVGRDGLAVSWNKVRGVDGYDVLLARCNHDGKKIALKKVATVKAGSALAFEKDGLKAQTSYKVRVRAYVKAGGKKAYVRNAKLVHVFTSGGTKARTNAKSVFVAKKSVKVAKGKTRVLDAHVVKLAKGKKPFSPHHVAALRFVSTNRSVATVSSEGMVKGIARGTCYVYVLAHNGVHKKVKVTVR